MSDGIAAATGQRAGNGDVSRDTRSRAVRLAAFTAECFPPAPQLLLVAFIWAAGMTMAVTLWQTSSAGALATSNVDPVRVALTLVGSLLFMFHLRVFDDVKDADHDRIHEMGRPIPRGLVSEGEVNALALLLLAVEAVIFAAVGPLALVAWAISAVFSVLMRVEFFVGEWLERHVLTYAISHMVIMGLLLATIVGAGVDALLGNANATIGSLFSDRWLVVAYVAAFLIGVGFELGRKFERYHAAHGTAAYLLWIACPTVGAGMFTVMGAATYAGWVAPALAIITVVALVALTVVMVQRPRVTNAAGAAEFGDRHRGLVDALPGVTGLLVYVVLAVAGVMAVNW